tara:strand:- start:1753 stop:2412 length:660 start_codon:yes stop_codon:yes gene_type:complete
MVEELLSLEEVAEEYPIILFDTCALLGRIKESEEGIENRIWEEEEQINSAIFLREFIENSGGFYITPEILREYSKGLNYSYKKKIKERGGKIQKRVLEIMRKSKVRAKERKKLVNSIEEFGKILRFEEDGEKMYGNLYNEYAETRRLKKIGYKDYGLLISGLVTSIKRKPTCIISNDFAILRAWGEILRRRWIDPSQFGFFTRNDFNGFQKASLAKKYK